MGSVSPSLLGDFAGEHMVESKGSAVSLSFAELRGGGGLNFVVVEGSANLGCPVGKNGWGGLFVRDRLHSRSWL